jgi:hypothetical protein
MITSKDGAVVTNPTKQNEPNDKAREAVVWIDRDWAVIVEQGLDCRDTVAVLDRRPAESEAIFEARTVEEIIDHDRVVVSGPCEPRTKFERAYVAMTHRPDRLVDVEPTSSIGRALPQLA